MRWESIPKLWTMCMYGIKTAPTTVTAKLIDPDKETVAGHQQSDHVKNWNCPEDTWLHACIPSLCQAHGLSPQTHCWQKLSTGVCRKEWPSRPWGLPSLAQCPLGWALGTPSLKFIRFLFIHRLAWLVSLPVCYHVHLSEALAHFNVRKCLLRKELSTFYQTGLALNRTQQLYTRSGGQFCEDSPLQARKVTKDITGKVLRS